MIRVQIQLPEEQADKLRELSRRRGVSIAALAREAIGRLLADAGPSRDELWERAMSVVGKYRDIEGRTDVAENHDRYLADIYYEQIERGRDDVR